jgi:hypothetical protein
VKKSWGYGSARPDTGSKFRKKQGWFPGYTRRKNGPIDTINPDGVAGFRVTEVLARFVEGGRGTNFAESVRD